MTGNVNYMYAKTNAKRIDGIDRFYEVDGKRYPSVTTIIKTLDKSGPLMVWAARSAVEYVMANRDTLNDKTVNEIAKKALERPAEISATACNTGTKVHDALEAFCHGETIEEHITAHPDTRKPVIAFLAWVSEHNFHPLKSEMLVYHKKGYAGTADCIAMVDDRLTLVDFKTSKAIYPEYVMQIAAYAKAYEEMTGDRIMQWGILRLDKETGMPEWKEYTAEEIHRAYMAFSKLLEFWKIWRN